MRVMASSAEGRTIPTAPGRGMISLMKWIEEHFAGIELPTDERSSLAIGCFDVAIEHQAAVAVLFSSGLYGSMFALLRVLTESLVLGLWLLHCATNVELSQFKKGRIDKSFGELVDEVESRLGGSIATLSNLKKNAWKAMNGFTHTGFNQVSRRHGEGTVGANYPETELRQSQSLAGALGLVAAGQLTGLSNRPELLEATIRRMKEYAKRAR
jgi:hypothetical protein